MKQVGKTQLMNAQHDPVEMKKCEDPVYFYNRYVRKEGEKVLTKEEYEEHVKKVDIFLRGRKGNIIKGVQQYPYKDELYGITKEAFDAATPKMPLTGEIPLIYGTAGEFETKTDTNENDILR